MSQIFFSKQPSIPASGPYALPLATGELLLCLEQHLSSSFCGLDVHRIVSPSPTFTLHTAWVAFSFSLIHFLRGSLTSAGGAQLCPVADGLEPAGNGHVQHNAAPATAHRPSLQSLLLPALVHQHPIQRVRGVFLGLF